MKLILSVIFALFFTLEVGAQKSGVTLNEAVNEVKSQGRILSAKTISGKHEIKLLTPSGTVKTIKRSAGSSSNAVKKDGSNYQQRRDWSTDFQRENNFDELKRQRGYPVNTQPSNNRSSNRNNSRSNSNRRQSNNNRSNQNNRSNKQPQRRQQDNNKRDKNR